MKFSLGYNYDIKLLDLLEVYKDNVEALYFPIPREYLGSGRCIREPKNYINQVPEIIKRCNSLNITSQLLLNPTYEGESGLRKKFFEQLVNYIKKLKDLGLKSLVIANPVYISRIKREIKDIRIESSVNCFVKTAEHALALKDLGVEVLTVDRDINRNIPLIEEIKNKTNLEIRIMLNEGCLRNCPFRVMHYNYLSQETKISKRAIEGIFHDKFCIQIYLRNPAKVFSIPFIPPDAVSYYRSFTDYYKLSTRTFPTLRIGLILKAYIAGQFNGNLLDILDCPGLSFFEYVDYDILKKNKFFKKMLNCNNDCRHCGFCTFLLEKATLINRNFLKRNKKIEKKAIRMYKNALKTSEEPDKPSIYANLSRAYFNLGEHREAIRLANKIIKQIPKQTDGYLLLGSHYEQSKKIRRALQVYKGALKLLPSQGDIYLGLARAYFQLKRYKQAIKKVNRVIELKHKGIGIHSLLGFCYQKLGQYRRAIKELKKEQKINPQDLQINLSMARCYRRLKGTSVSYRRKLAYKELNKIKK